MRALAQGADSREPCLLHLVDLGGLKAVDELMEHATPIYSTTCRRIAGTLVL